MAHSITLSTDDCARKLEKCFCKAAAVSCSGKMFFTIVRIDADDAVHYFIGRHDIVSATSEFFRWDSFGGSVVNMYSLSDELIVVIMYKQRYHLVCQHLVQLVSSTVPEEDDALWGEKKEGIAYTNCTRTKTLLGMREECTVTIAMGMVHSGVLLVTAKQSWDIHNIPSIQAHLIASNPLLIDRYPDVNLTSHVLELAQLARAKSLTLYYPMMTEKGVFYVLCKTPATEPDEDNDEPALLVSHMLGAVYFTANDVYTIKLETFGNKDVVNPEHWTDRNLVAFSQMQAFGYLVFRSPDTDILNSWSWWWKERRRRAKSLVLSTAFKLLTWLESFDREANNFVEELGILPYQRRINSLVIPKRYYAYAVDFRNLKFRRIPYEKEVIEELPPFCKAAPNGAFFIIHMPCRHYRVRGEIIPKLDVTLLWEPSNPPTLREIAERAVLRDTPEYREEEFRKSHGLLEYRKNEETRATTFYSRNALSAESFIRER